MISRIDMASIIEKVDSSISISQGIKASFPDLTTLISRLKEPEVQLNTAGAICSQILTDIELFRFYIVTIGDLALFLAELGAPFKKSILDSMLEPEFCEYLIQNKTNWEQFCKLFPDVSPNEIYRLLPYKVRDTLSQDGFVNISSPHSPQIFKSSSGSENKKLMQKDVAVANTRQCDGLKNR